MSFPELTAMYIGVPDYVTVLQLAISAGLISNTIINIWNQFVTPAAIQSWSGKVTLWSRCISNGAWLLAAVIPRGTRAMLCLNVRRRQLLSTIKM